ncbi:transposase [Aromatoleum buckelii]|uniref:transposase n=1 Tax=Aromatoleum buckelii TaxID=200254 RepID=UPI001FF52151|nr:transposase [Aromatoleum buckelii]MCK0509509.1 transposase [Aromatoleum buckelii]
MVLTDEQWQAIEERLPGKSGDRGAQPKTIGCSSRRCCGWRARAARGAICPPEFGNWHSTYMRFARWRDAGVWDRIAFALAGERDLGQVFIDSTIVRAHRHASGTQKK